MAPVRKTVLKGKKKSKEIFIWCDESDRKGKFFSDFYGGVLVESIHLKEVYEILNRSCKMLHLKDEMIQMLLEQQAHLMLLVRSV